MGQRSHLVIGYKGYAYEEWKPVEVQKRYVRYLHWNWGEYMVMRAAQVIEYLTVSARRGPHVSQDENAMGALATFCVNYATGVTQGLHEDDDDSGSTSRHWDNNNGAFVIEMGDNGDYSFGFLTGTEEKRNVNGREVTPLKTVLTAREYLQASSYSFDAEHEWADKVREALDTIEAVEGEHTISPKRVRFLLGMDTDRMPLEGATSQAE